MFCSNLPNNFSPIPDNLHVHAARPIGMRNKVDLGEFSLKYDKRRFNLFAKLCALLGADMVNKAALQKPGCSTLKNKPEKVPETT